MLAAGSVVELTERVLQEKVSHYYNHSSDRAMKSTKVLTSVLISAVARAQAFDNAHASTR